MKTHELLDAANIDPSTWTLTAGVYFGTPGEETDEYLGAALDELCAAAGADVYFLPSQNRSDVVKTYPTLIDSRFRNRGTCDHCGAWFKFGSVYTHTTGVVCVVGNTCAEKTMASPDRVTLMIKRAKRAAEVKAAQVKFARERDERLTAFLATDEGAKIAAFLLNCDKGFLGSMNESLHKWGRLTPAQHAAVLKIMNPPVREVLPPSEYQGEVGKPITVDVEIKATNTRDTQFGPVHWHLMVDAKGNVYTARGVYLGQRGDKLVGTFTVKAHELYNGTCQTVLQRPRKLTLTKSPGGAE